MKNALRYIVRYFAMSIISFFLLPPQSLAAQTIVDYGKDAGSAKVEMPNFKNAVIGINAPEGFADEIERALVKKGARKFVHNTDHPCNIGRPVVCFSFSGIEQGPQLNAWYNDANYGRRAYNASSGAFSGNYFARVVYVDLVVPGESPVALGSAVSVSVAGQRNNWSSFAGLRYSNSYGSAITTSPADAGYSAAKKAVMKLLDTTFWRKLDLSTKASWKGYAARAVAETEF